MSVQLYLFELIILLLSGLCSGAFVGMGAGATGSIMITSLTVFIGHPIYQSIGTTLFIDFIIGAIAGLIFYFKGNTNIKPAMPLILTAALGSFIGSQFTSSAPGSVLIILIGSILILIGISLVIKGINRNIDFIKEKKITKLLKTKKNIFFIIFGFLAGASSGFTGMGIGGVIALVLLVILDYDIHTAIGTALLSIMVISGAASLGHILNAQILILQGSIAGAAAIAGGVFGAFYANTIKENTLGKLIGAIISIMGIILIIRAFM
jgi:uncharacterized protein